jgi:hypothetical protein
MKRNQEKFFFFITVLLFSILLITAQEEENIPIQVTPDRYRIIEGETPPTFSIKTEPNKMVSVEVANEIRFFLEKDYRTKNNFFSSYLGNELGERDSIITDEQGKASYTLPDGPFKAITKGKDKLYYLALVIDPRPDRDAIRFWVLGESHDTVMDEENSPYIDIYDQESGAKAKTHFLQAQAHYLKEEFLEATQEFETASSYAWYPEFDYNTAVCYLKLSIKYLEYYTSTGEAPEEEVTKIEDFIKKIDEFTSSLK